jgi:release factor glutamine methyltransferase
MKSVLEVIQATVPYFQKSGVESPRLNIEHLLAHVLGKKRMDLYLEFDRPLGDGDLEPLRDLVKRRAQGEPLQHLLGTIEFLGRTFACDKRALVPRPETEQLVELAMVDCGSCIGKGRVLDVGTGSGVIALSLAAGFPEAQVEAVDVSEDALALARENAARLGLDGRVRFSNSDLLSDVTGEFQLIVANLPYIDCAALPVLPREVQHDPLLALDGGADGLVLIRQLIAQAPRHLRGRLALELSYDQAPFVCEIFASHNYQDIRALPDYQGRQRFVFATYG